MARLVSVPNLAVDDAVTESYVDAVTLSHNYLALGGPDLASSGTIHISSHFHKVTGTTLISTITDDLGAVAGQPLELQFGSALTVGASGNIIPPGGVAYSAGAGETVHLTYDGASWVMHSPERHYPGDYKTSAQAASHGPWLLCDGSAVSRATYAALFAAVGTVFGVGDGTTTFNVPDAQGRALVMKGTHADVDALNDNDGVALANRTPKHNTTNALTLPDHVHSHSLTLPNHVHSGVYDHSIAQAASGAARDTSAAGINTGNPTSNPAINGTIGSVTATPAIGGSIGPGGTRPIDTAAYIVPGNLFIHV